MKAAEAAEFFDTRAGAYDSSYDDSVHGRLLRRRLDVVVRFAGDGPGEALDAGMGGGRLVAALAERGWEMSGADLSAGMVALARARLPAAVSRLVEAPLERLPFAEGSFDLVIATGVIEYAEDPARALGELARTLRGGGRMIVSCPNSAGVPVRLDHLLARVRRPAGQPWKGGVRRLESLLGGAGLRVLEEEACSVRALPRPLARLMPGLDDRLGRALEGRSETVARRFATQIVVVATKTEP